MVESEKPVVVVGSIRPATLMSADGPLDLYHSVAVAGRREFDVQKLERLPQVDVVYGYGGDTRVGVDAFVNAGAQGIVVAGTGTAAISERMMPAVQEAVKKGVVVVRSPRTSLGIITRNMEIEDDKYGTVSCDTLNPPKARTLLLVALTKTSAPREVQRIFDQS